jgi:hypothetical protein
MSSMPGATTPAQPDPTPGTCRSAQHGGIGTSSANYITKMGMLDDRAKLLMKALVERYIADGSAGGVAHLVAPAGWNCRRRPSAT